MPKGNQQNQLPVGAPIFNRLCAPPTPLPPSISPRRSQDYEFRVPRSAISRKPTNTHQNPEEKNELNNSPRRTIVRPFVVPGSDEGGQSQVAVAESRSCPIAPDRSRGKASRQHISASTFSVQRSTFDVPILSRFCILHSSFCIRSAFRVRYVPHCPQPR
jgi:hypothetical protein